MILEARQYGVLPGREVARQLAHMMMELQSVREPCTVLFEQGTYRVDASRLQTCPMYITNTVGDGEWRPDETPHENRAALLLRGIRHVTLEGNGAEFVLYGQATNMALIDCDHVTIRNICFTAVCPDMHEFEVVRAGLFWVDFRLDPESRYVRRGGRYYFTGPGYRTDFYNARATAHWIGKIDRRDSGKLRRVAHPFCGAVRIREIGDRLFRVYDPLAVRFRRGERYALFDVRRKYNGIFINRCAHIELEGVIQRFNYGLALVAQDCDTLTFSGLRFMPQPDGARLMASVADFMQICMCRGRVVVQDSVFEGAGDDCLNAHGIHFKIVQLEGRRITVRFMHPQTHGFNPLRVGDRITYVEPETLQCHGNAVILTSEMLDEYHIRLELDNAAAAKNGLVVEDIDASPELIFAHNRIDRIITRGLLLTVRGKVRICNNIFAHTSMSHILISDDAANWYESGCVRDVLIAYNTFLHSPAYTLAVKPENRRHAGAVHTGITFCHNSVRTPSYLIRSADGVRIYANQTKRKETFQIKHSSVQREEPPEQSDGRETY